MTGKWKKNTALFLTSQTISMMGSSLVQYAIMWYITLETKSGVMMTISIVCGLLPGFFLSPFAGVWADRYNRKRLIMFADAGIAFVTLLLAISFLLGYKAMWLLFFISAVRSLGSAIQMPAVGAFLPQIVPVEKLTRVNGINASIQSVMMILAPALSGLILSLYGIVAIFFIDVITASTAVLTLMFFLHIPLHSKASRIQTTSYFTDLKMGFDYINTHRFLKKFFFFMGMFLFLIAPVAFLTPLQVTRSFGSDVWRLTMIEIAFAVGMTLGGILMVTWGGFSNRMITMFVSCLMVGLGTLALGLVDNFTIYLVLMALSGATLPIFNTPATVILQEKVENDYLGRVFGVTNMIGSSVMPLAMLIFGPLADSFRIEWMLIGTGILIFIEAFILIGSKELMEAGMPISAVE